MKSLLIRFFSLLGYRVSHVKKKNYPAELDGFRFEEVRPDANYAPWLTDKRFDDVYTQINGFTLVDRYRCYELWELAETVSHLDPLANFIEIGVWRGGTAAIVAQKLAMVQSQATFYLADTFSGVVKATDRDASYVGGEHADTSVETVTGLLKNKYHSIKILQGIFPDDTAHLIPPDQKFGYCHVDVDVYQSANDIVDWIWNKMIIGGVIVFDDYGFSTCTGITKYVNAQKNKSDRLIVHNLNGHAIMIKLR